VIPPRGRIGSEPLIYGHGTAKADRFDRLREGLPSRLVWLCRGPHEAPCAAIEILPELVKCRPGYTEQLGDLRDRPALGSHASKHLEPGSDHEVEELTVDKSRVLNIFCASIGSATALERGQLGVWF
jgi:hypothetical protein